MENMPKKTDEQINLKNEAENEYEFELRLRLSGRSRRYITIALYVASAVTIFRILQIIWQGQG